METSVAMCTFNGARYIQEQLESILGQTTTPEELIVCDDGSKDDTLQIVEKFAQRAPFPVRIFQNEKNLGPAKNFESALGRCSGRVIFLSDQDDRWQPEKIQTILKHFAEHPDALYAFSDANVISNDDNTAGRRLWDLVEFQHRGFQGASQIKRLLKGNVITGAGMALRSSLLPLALPIPSGWMHDYWIGLLGSSISDGIPINEPLFSYRLHPNQVCGWGKISFGEVVQVSLKSDANALVRRRAEFETLTGRLKDTVGFSPDPLRVRLLEEKENHLEVRASLRSLKGAARALKVFREAATGRYHRFSNSYYSIIRDLCSN